MNLIELTTVLLGCSKLDPLHPGAATQRRFTRRPGGVPATVLGQDGLATAERSTQRAAAKSSAGGPVAPLSAGCLGGCHVDERDMHWNSLFVNILLKSKCTSN